MEITSIPLEYTTQEVADKIGVSKMTLLRWLWDGKIPEVGGVVCGKVRSRVWSEEDLARVRAYAEGPRLRKKRRST